LNIEAMFSKRLTAVLLLVPFAFSIPVENVAKRQSVDTSQHYVMPAR